MMRSLWTAASGMISQQTNVDTISNNLANINTTGYKAETNEFKTLLYQTIQEMSTDSEGEPKPVGIQVGLGVRNSAITSKFTQGPLQQTEGAFDFAIDGDGFFRVRMPDSSIAYTRAGNLKMSIGTTGTTLCTSDGYAILDTAGNPIVVDANYNTSNISIDENGNLWYKEQTTNENGTTNTQTTALGIQVSLAQFNNPAGLEKISGSLLKETDASGSPRLEGEDASLKTSRILQGYLEMSNVQAVDEMVNLIVAQRAYEMNSKAITASDEMLQQANNLRS